MATTTTVLKTVVSLVTVSFDYNGFIVTLSDNVLPHPIQVKVYIGRCNASRCTIINKYGEKCTLEVTMLAPKGDKPRCLDIDIDVPSGTSTGYTRVLV